jgi:outer membrane biogenesis lipoprotein LolB
MMFRACCYVVVVVCLALSAGCASLPNPPASPRENASITAPDKVIQQFVLMGRISIRVGDKLDTARIEWTRDVGAARPTRESMKFFTPFGSQVAEITTTEKGVVLRQGESVVEAADFAWLTNQLFGVAIDTASLAKWVQGAELDRAQPISYGEPGSAPRKWQITAENFRPVEGVPGARVAARVTAIEGDTVLRVVVDQFRAL